MRRLALAVTALVLLAPALPATANEVHTIQDVSTDPPAYGPLCGLTAATDPTAGGGVQTGLLSAGPIVYVDEVDPLALHTIAVSCSIQVGPDWQHSHPDAVTAVGPFQPSPVFLPPTFVSYYAPPTWPVYVCTRLIVDGWQSLYWDSWAQQWSTSPFVPCSLVISFTPPGGLAPCDDGADNDGDGRTDYPADPGCTSASDLSETDPGGAGCSDLGVAEVCVALTPGPVDGTFSVAPTSTSTHVAAYVDIYRFTLPNDGTVDLPCAVLVRDSTTTNPCPSAGGVFVSRSQTLWDDPVGAAGTPLNQPLPLVRICEADLVLTVAGIGISSFPAYTVC